MLTLPLVAACTSASPAIPRAPHSSILEPAAVPVAILGGTILGQPPGLWASWLEIAKKAPLVARDIDQPLLVLGGGYDFNVAVSEIDSWDQWLTAAKPGRHRIKVFPCVTHALNCITEPNPARVRETDIGREIHP